MINKKTTFHKMETRQIDDLTFEFIISNETKDRHRTVLDSDNWNLDGYNGVFYWMHQTNSTDPNVALGTSTIHFDNRHMISVSKFMTPGKNHLADSVRGHVEEGTIKMASVGFNELERGSMGKKSMGQDPDIYYFGERELLEHSIVHIGSNRDAYKRCMDDINDIIEQAKRARDGEIIKDLNGQISAERARHIYYTL